MIDDATRNLALETFRTILKDPGAKPVDQLRAAEGVLKLDQEQKDRGLGDVLDASDEELLLRARGEYEKRPSQSLEAFVAGE